jgi:putative YhdH/YhfP family quinone oxidoreductase
MDNRVFKAMIVEEQEDGAFRRHVGEKGIDELPPGDVLIQVAWSSLNYKDALSATGNRGVTRSYPHTPGIDAAGVVVESDSGEFQPGQEVLVTGYDLGMNTSGGFGRYVRVPAGWVVPKPASMSMRETMIYGTAGFTAALCVLKILDQGIRPEDGDVLVTGASGGVGSMALSMLARSGYAVTAVSGKADKEDFLKELGAAQVVGREEVLDTSKKPMLKGRWIGVVDTVGGDMLASALKAAQLHAVVSCCGNVGGFKLETTVFPFILRGVSLMGVDSANCPRTPRLRAWETIAGDWKLDHLEDMTTEVALENLDPHIDEILRSAVTGRTVVRLGD